MITEIHTVEHDRPVVDHERRWLPTWGDVGRFGAAYAGLTAIWFVLGKALLASSAVVSTDEDVSEWLADRRTTSLDRWTAIGSDLADTIVKIALTALVAAVMAAAWRRRKEPMMVVVPLLLEAAVFITVTWLVGRPRPAVERLEGSPVNSSFPSGHVAAATVYFAFVVVLFWHTRGVWLRTLSVAVIGAVVAIVSFARLYRGMHHLSDVLAGVALGAVSIAVSWWLVRRATERDEPSPVERPVRAEAPVVARG